MAENGSSTVTRRQLARHLRELRTNAELTMDQAAEQLGISLSTLSRIEHAKTSVSQPTVRAMCDLYGRPDLLAPLRDLARASKSKSWYHEYRDLIPDWFSSYIGLERDAARIHTYETDLVPGILQTADYARVVMVTDNPGEPDEEIDRRVALRMKRQELLTRSDRPQHWRILIGEAILRRPVGGPAVMARQLQHLLDASELPTVDLGVVPFANGMHEGVTAGPFVLLSFPDSVPTTVYVEGLTGALCTDDPGVVDRYRRVLKGIEKATFTTEDTRALIARAAKEMQQ